MQSMELVHIDDVYPYEEHDVRMNPRDVDSKECREYIAQLAEQFKYNKLNPGQPRVRPILYKDGGIYQIIDGECRYEAMKLLGTKYFYADVFDDLDDAETARQEAAKAMVETDAKRSLTDEEMSRGVQMMLSLDIPDEEVAAVARIDAGRVSRARRGARVASDAAYDMTLDRLAAIAEFEGNGEAVAALRDCSQGEWRQVYARLVGERNHREALRLARKTLDAAGFRDVSEDREGCRVVESVYVDNQSDPQGVAKRVANVIAKGGCSLYTARGHWIELMRPETEEERAEEREQSERRRAEDRERSRLSELWDLERQARCDWVASRLGDLGSMRATASTLADRVMEMAADLIARTGAEADFSPTPALVLAGLSAVWVPDNFQAMQLAMGRSMGTFYMQCEKVRWFLELSAAMEKDGYVPNEAGASVVEALGKWEENNGK